MAVLTSQTVFIKEKHMILLHLKHFLKGVSFLLLVCLLSFEIVNHGDLFDEEADVKNSQ